ncbi:MAG: hypothetical protein LDL41_18615 [Coleofasciculus sp. S288]|nr:hypothetical protein [Coleofasciculus sp. S288]
MYSSSIQLINLIVILLGVGITSFGCKPSSPTSQENQASPSPQANQTLPLPPVETQPTPQASPTQSPLQASPTPSSPQAYQVLPVPQVYQTRPVPRVEEIPSNPQAYQPPSNPQVYQSPATPPAHQTPSIPQTNQTRPIPPIEQAANSKNQGLKNLPDGYYFYGELPETNSTGSKYVVFRKTGNLITGQEYILQSDHSNCFRGTADVNGIANVKIAYLEPSREGAKWSFGERDSITTNELHPLSFEKAPDFATRNLRECINLFAART